MTKILKPSKAGDNKVLCFKGTSMGDVTYLSEDLVRKYGLIKKLSSIRSVSAAKLDYAKQKQT